MVLSYSGYYTGLSSRISGFDSPQDRQVIVVKENENEYKRYGWKSVHIGDTRWY